MRTHLHETVQSARGGVSSAPPAAPLLSPGTLVEHFRIMRLLGRGGMGETYLARDSKLGRRTAIKMIRNELLGSREAVAGFVREARTTARFNHPHIVTVYAVGDYDGFPYLALEYLEGQTLRQRIEERFPSLQESLRIAHAVAQALVEAHAHGVLHRDLKPENVIIPADGRLRVLDFGLAQKLEGSEAEPGRDGLSSTLPPPSERPGTLGFGTPAYMAPEQWHRVECTEKTDIWALGVILYELCAGRLPYEVYDPLEMGIAVCSESPVPPVDEHCELPAEVSELISKCLSKAPDQRPKADQLARALAEMLPAARSTLSAEQSPYPGLLPFTERYASLLFGRDEEISAFVELARTQPVLPVVGPSGAGKTSFMQAGVIPRMREQNSWVVLRMRPGARPFFALAACMVERETQGSFGVGRHVLDVDGPVSEERESVDVQVDGVHDQRSLAAQLAASVGQLALELRAMAEARQSRVLLVVEQLEELFTLVDDERTQRAFMESICRAADDAFDPVRVVFTVRDDFLGRLATSQLTRSALRQLTVIRRPDAERLEEIVRKQVAAVGYQYEDTELVRQIVSEVSGEPACLPLLQFASQLMWEQRDKLHCLLTRAAYERMGGVAGALR